MNFKPFFKIAVILIGLMIFSACSTDQQSTSNSDTPDANGGKNKSTMTTVKVKAPTAKKVAKELTIHNDTRTDNYYWLNQREDPEVISYLESENDYTKSVMKHTESFQEKLYDEIIGRIKKDDTSVPYKDNGYWYLTRYEEGKEYPIYARKKGTLDAKEEITLNVNEMAKDYEFYSAVGLRPSPNNKLMAFGQDTLSRRIYTIRIKNLETGAYLKDEIPNCTGGSVWANDNKTLFYTVKDDALRAYKIFKHTLGTDVSEDEEVYHEADDTYSCYVYKTKSKKYIVIGSYHTLTSEFRYLDANKSDGEFKVFEPRDRAMSLRLENKYVLKIFEKKS